MKEPDFFDLLLPPAPVADRMAAEGPKGRGYLSSHFLGAGAKTLRATEVDLKTSKGHEFQGVDIFRTFVGAPEGREKIAVTYMWMDDSGAPPLRLDHHATWYNSRKAEARAPEYRMYYPRAADVIVRQASPGDTLFLCMTAGRRVLAILCPAASSVEQKLLWLFGLSLTTDCRLSARDLEADGGRGLDLAARWVLDELGLSEADGPAPEVAPAALDRMSARFGTEFPGTREFSAFAREMAPDVDPLADPDGTLLAWMEQEEILFRQLERAIVAVRLGQGFMQGSNADVDGFLSFSLSVQNRRKSRAGYAFAHHVEALLQIWGIPHTREATTEKRNAADFLFPGEAQYADPAFDPAGLRILAVKTTCKDRWRQVLAEADRVPLKHLLTLEPAISRAQTAEMRSHDLQLVLPQPLHETYHPDQRGWLMSLRDYLMLVRPQG